MRIRRDISSIPLRSASETWEEIVALISRTGSMCVDQLRAAKGVMGSIITDEHPSKRAIILEGVGPQLRLYCSYGETAIESGGDVDALQWNPTAGDWTMHVPCDEENISWVRASLKKSSPRIKVFDVEEQDRFEELEEPVAAKAIAIDWNVKE